MTTAEQKARNLLDRLSSSTYYTDPQRLSSGDVVELAQLFAEIERLTRENAGLLGKVKYWQRTYGAAQSELVELRDKLAAKAAGGYNE